MEISVNLAAVVVAALLAFILGWTWYSPLLFGNIWMKGMGMKKPEKMTKDVKSLMCRSSTITVIFALVKAYTLANILLYMNVVGLSSVLALSGWLWLGFIVPVQMSAHAWEGKSLTLVGINASYELASLILIGVVVTAWPV